MHVCMYVPRYSNLSNLFEKLKIKLGKRGVGLFSSTLSFSSLQSSFSFYVVCPFRLIRFVIREKQGLITTVVIRVPLF